MGNLLEMLGLKKSQEEIMRQESIQGMEKYLAETIAQYKMNQGRLQNMPETFIGQGHREDGRDINAARNSLESLRKIILVTSDKLGKDGNALIAETDEEAQRAQEITKAA